MLPIFKKSDEIFMGSKADDEVDDEADDEVDDETDEQPDTTDMPELENEESTAQQGQGVKILSKQQMITRLPVLLAQLQAGNNLQKLKNETRQLLYSLYRSKKLRKTICNSLMNTI